MQKNDTYFLFYWLIYNENRLKDILKYANYMYFIKNYMYDK